jgi:hypothetical protein
VLFKSTSLAAQWASIHPEVRVALGELDDQLDAWGLPTLTVTDAIRTKAQQEDLYWRMYLGSGVLEVAAREKARRKFSWHLTACAVDFRGSKPWEAPDERRIRSWLRKRCPTPQWECLLHDAGTGVHFHVAHKDFGWRRKWEHPEGRV